MLAYAAAIVLRFLGFGPQPLWLYREELRSSLRHHDRQVQHRPPVESKAAAAIRMMAIVSAPGMYVGLGDKIIKERRCLPRIKNY